VTIARHVQGNVCAHVTHRPLHQSGSPQAEPSGTTLPNIQAVVDLDRETRRERADRRAHLDLQVNLLAEQELTAILRVVCLIAEKTGLELEGCDPNLDQLLGRTDVRALNDELTKEMATVDRATEAVSVDTTAATKDGRARIRISHASGWRHMSGPRPEVRRTTSVARLISAAVRPPCAEHRPESLKTASYATNCEQVTRPSLVSR
jgi:hypothetical protein